MRKSSIYRKARPWLSDVGLLKEIGNCIFIPESTAGAWVAGTDDELLLK